MDYLWVSLRNTHTSIFLIFLLTKEQKLNHGSNAIFFVKVLLLIQMPTRKVAVTLIPCLGQTVIVRHPQRCVSYWVWRGTLFQLLGHLCGCWNLAVVQCWAMGWWVKLWSERNYSHVFWSVLFINCKINFVFSLINSSSLCFLEAPVDSHVHVPQITVLRGAGPVIVHCMACIYGQLLKYECNWKLS